MNTLNTITVRKGRITLAISKLELLNQEEARPILALLLQRFNASLYEIIHETGLDAAVVEDYLEQLLLHGFVWKEQDLSNTRYTLDQSYLNKVTNIARTLAGFWR